jgi:hypothetical protein
MGSGDAARSRALLCWIWQQHQVPSARRRGLPCGVLDCVEQGRGVVRGAARGRGAWTGKNSGSEQFSGDAGAAVAGGYLVREPGGWGASRHCEPVGVDQVVAVLAGHPVVAEDLGQGRPPVRSPRAVLSHEGEPCRGQVRAPA